MNKEEFKKECEKANAVLEAFAFTDDPKADLKTVNAGIKIVRVTRLLKRTRMIIAAFLAVLAGAGVIVGGIISHDTAMLGISVVFGAILLCVGTSWFLSLRSAVTHKAICILAGGKVQEFIYSKRGGFIYNTIEDELVCERGKVSKGKHKWVHYEPSYPYVDYLDRDFSNFLKARTGEGYDGGEVYERDKATNIISAYYDEKKKKRKLAVCFEDNKPYKVIYGQSECYVYSHLNDCEQVLYLPALVKNKLTPPQFLNAEYVDFQKDFTKVWCNL